MSSASRPKQGSNTKLKINALRSTKVDLMGKEVDVDKVGVGGAKNFFQAREDQANKEKELLHGIKAESEKVKQERREAAQRRKVCGIYLVSMWYL